VKGEKIFRVQNWTKPFETQVGSRPGAKILSKVGSVSGKNSFGFIRNIDIRGRRHSSFNGINVEASSRLRILLVAWIRIRIPNVNPDLGGIKVKGETQPKDE
jgi:hypothetical protein